VSRRAESGRPRACDRRLRPARSDLTFDPLGSMASDGDARSSWLHGPEFPRKLWVPSFGIRGGKEAGEPANAIASSLPSLTRAPTAPDSQVHYHGGYEPQGHRLLDRGWQGVHHIRCAKVHRRGHAFALLAIPLKIQLRQLRQAAEQLRESPVPRAPDTNLPRVQSPSSRLDLYHGPGHRAGPGVALDSAPGPRSSHPPGPDVIAHFSATLAGTENVKKNWLHILTSFTPSIAEHLRASVRSSRTPGPSPTPGFSGAARRTSTGLRAKVSGIREGTRRCRSPSRSKGWRCSRTRGAWVWAWADRSSTRG